MDCPICNASMDEGEVHLKKSLSNMLAFGWGSTELVFKESKTSKHTELMNSWDFSKAFYCSNCGASLIASKTGSGTRC